ncbi:MAG: hypothetical protein ACR2L2_04985 [Acidobacteriota bacterium]
MLLVGSLAQAQDRQPAPSSGSESRPSAPDVSSTSAPSTGDRGTSSTSASSTGFSSSASGTGLANSGGGWSDGGRSYNPYYDPNYLRFVDFLHMMQFRYGFFGGDLYLYRYLNGEPFLNNRMVQMALTDTVGNSDRLLGLTLQLEDIVQDLVDGKSTDVALDKKKAQELTSEIRNLSRKIKSDDFLEYIEPSRREQQLVQSKGGDVRQQLAELQTFVRQLRTELTNMRSQDATVVDVRRLSKPSVRSLSRSIETLTSSLNSSIKKIS